VQNDVVYPSSEFENAELESMKDFADASCSRVIEHAKKTGFWSGWRTNTSAMFGAEFPGRSIAEELKAIRGQSQVQGFFAVLPCGEFGLASEPESTDGREVLERTK